MFNGSLSNNIETVISSYFHCHGVLLPPSTTAAAFTAINEHCNTADQESALIAQVWQDSQRKSGE